MGKLPKARWGLEKCLEMQLLEVQPALAHFLNEKRLFCWDNRSCLKHSERLYLSPNYLYHFNLKAFKNYHPNE